MLQNLVTSSELPMKNVTIMASTKHFSLMMQRKERSVAMVQEEGNKNSENITEKLIVHLVVVQLLQKCSYLFFLISCL